MDKSIDTLIFDIYSLFDNTKTHTPSEENLEKLAEGIKSHVRNALAEAKKEDVDRVLRMSSIGKKPRQLWYTAQHAKGSGSGASTKEEFTASKLFSFLYGNIIEELIMFFAREAGHKVDRQQKEVELEDVKGKLDAYIDDVLVDAKSASFRSFDKFKNGSLLNGNDDFGYVDQLSGYAQAEKQDLACFLAFNKETGEMALLKLNHLDLKDVVPQIRELKIALSKPTPPPKCYEDVPDGSSGNRTLAVGCKYCPWKVECWKDANGGRGLQVYKYSSGNKFMTRISREPLVENITREFLSGKEE